MSPERLMSSGQFDEIFELLVRVLPVVHKKIHRDIFKVTIEQAGGDMSPHHLMILKMLRDGGLFTMSEIGEEIAVSQSQMTHSTDKLIKLGLITRKAGTADRRKINIRLTARGREYLEKLEPAMKRRVESKLSLLSDNDMVKLAVSLRDLAGIFRKLHWE